jgi:uncharacterized OB-fold protein/acyl dehydratase
VNAGGGSPEADGFPNHGDELAALVGSATGPPLLSPTAVNPAMIIHWVEAMGDANPVYTSDVAARAVGLDRAIAPPTMLQAWVMRGLRATLELEEARAQGRPAGGSPNEQLMALLDDEGMTSVVATNCEQRYDRPLVAGDRLLSSSVIESISDVKRTALGAGRFVTTRTDFVAVPDTEVPPDADAEALWDAGEPVGSMHFRILKYRPVAAGAGDAGTTDEAGEPPPRRPRPAVTEDIAFWFEGARHHQLLIQRCADCGALRHPPLPACPTCRSFEWDTVEASGRGEIYSFVVVHYPQVPAFEYPLAIALVELEEGTRLVADLDGLEPSEWRIGMPVVAHFVDYDAELSLPVFRPVGRPGRAPSSGGASVPHAAVGGR